MSSTPLAPIDYDALDAGIRDTVRILREAGFDTTDSGDGVSKEADALCVLSYPHVWAVIDPSQIVPEACRMLGVLGPEWDVEASYKPGQGAMLLATRGAMEAAMALYATGAPN